MTTKEGSAERESFDSTLDEEDKESEISDGVDDVKNAYAEQLSADPALGREVSSDGIKLISAYHFVWSILMILLMCATSIPTVITGIVAIAEDPGVFIATAILGLAVFVLLLLSIIYAVVGYGLWTQRHWARTAAIALGILSLPAVPIGTVGGGITLWYLLQDRVAQKFR